MKTNLQEDWNMDINENELTNPFGEHHGRSYREATMSSEQVTDLKQTIERAKREKRRLRKKAVVTRTLSVAAALLAAFIILPNTSSNVAYAMSQMPLVGGFVKAVTFRNYQYVDERNQADIQVPEIVATVPYDEEMSGVDTSQNDVLYAEDNLSSEPPQEALQKTAEEINAEIKEITEQLVAEFEANLSYEEGYQNVVVTSEVLNTTENYFTLKLICYQASGSGAEWDYFYTIDLQTGERILLQDLFQENADYITPVSEDIKKQMRAQMAADENVFYWIDQTDVPVWDFEAITEDTSFYLDEVGNLVIAFDEGEVAPMYMGCVEFTISPEAIQDIRK